MFAAQINVITRCNEVLRPLLLLLRQFDKDVGKFGSRVDGRGRNKNEILDWFVVVTLAHHHQIVDELKSSGYIHAQSHESNKNPHHDSIFLFHRQGQQTFVPSNLYTHVYIYKIAK